MYIKKVSMGPGEGKIRLAGILLAVTPQVE